MKTRQLGKTGFNVTELSFGGAAISGEGGGYGFGDITETDALSLVQHAQDRGINLFDTAPIYGFRTSEIRLGKALKGSRRDKAFIVSKSGIDWHDNKRVNLTNEPKVVMKMLEQSLKDLQTEQIDLYMVHWPDPRVDIRQPMEVYVKAQEQGKIKHIGLCNTNEDDYQRASEVANIDVLQAEYNFFKRENGDQLFPITRDENIGFMSWGTLEKGILTYRVSKERNFDESDARSHAPWWKQSDWQKKVDFMQTIKPKLEAAGVSGTSLALKHNLLAPEVSTVICGSRSPEQVDSLLQAYENLPSDELVTELLAESEAYFAS